MSQDILIGAADNYSWAQIKPWVVSARASGFTGLMYLITYRMEESVLQELAAYDVETYRCNHTPMMTAIQHGHDTQAHNLRFYHMWELLTQVAVTNQPIDYVIATDVSDVVFQTNPSDWLREAEIPLTHFVAPSEGILYRDEPWGQNNLTAGFGPVVWELLMRDAMVYNVGTIAGGFDIMRKLALLIFSMSEGRYYPADQSSFNILVHDTMREQAECITMFESWAAQIGTTGDPTQPWHWDRLAQSARPKLDHGRVVTPSGEPYAIVHQYNRNPEMKALFAAKYAM